LSSEIASQGSLFTSDFLTESIQNVSEWNTLGDADLDQFGKIVRSVFDRFPISQTPNESQTEDDLIWPILEALKRRPGRTASPKNGSDTSLAAPWLSPKDGRAHSIGDLADVERKPRPRPRCSATCAASTT
jgi:hypothetical protein